MQVLKSHKTFQGTTMFCQHESSVNQSAMNFSLFIPQGKVTHCIVFLSGYTCTEENFIMKSGVQRFLDGTQTMIAIPDTSPRNLDDKILAKAYGASFYVDATTPVFKKNFQMFSYVNQEFYQLIKKQFGVSSFSIMGHSMGGHGALISALKNPHLYQSVSCFAPVCNPIASPLARQIFTALLGEDKSAWEDYDTCSLLEKGLTYPHLILIDQGLSDDKMKVTLLPEALEKAAQHAGQKIKLNYHLGYDHSYYFVSTFIEGHIKFHLSTY